MTSPARAPRAAEPAVPAGPPPENESRWWWAAAAAIVLGCVALLVNLVATVRDQPGAGGPAPTADGAVGQAPVTIPATVAPTTTEHPGDAAVAAYHASWAAYVAAAQIPDPYHPGLAETMTGPSLQRVRDGFESRRVSGRASRFPGPREVQASYRTVRDGRAVLNVCYVDDEVVYVKATGQVVNDEVITQYMEVEMAFLDGRWKRFDTIGLEEKQGRVPCAS